jgi:hypothetical protein
VNNKHFKVEEMVLRKLKAIENIEGRGKLVPQWDDLFKVVRAIISNTEHLQDKQGENLLYMWNYDHLKIYLLLLKHQVFNLYFCDEILFSCLCLSISTGDISLY